MPDIPSEGICLAKHRGRACYRTIDEKGEELLKPYTHWAEVWETVKTSDGILWMLDQIGCRDDSTLRLFACWCVRQSLPYISGWNSYCIVEVTERYARGKATREELAAARKKASGGAAGAGVCGLPRREPSAAAQLAAFHTTNEDSFRCAYWSARYAAQTASFAAWQESKDETKTEAEWFAQTAQGEKLTEMLGNLFTRCIIDIGIGPNSLARLLVLGFAPQLQSGERCRWRFFSKLLDMECSFEELI